MGSLKRDEGRPRNPTPILAEEKMFFFFKLYTKHKAIGLDEANPNRVIKDKSIQEGRHAGSCMLVISVHQKERS